MRRLLTSVAFALSLAPAALAAGNLASQPTTLNLAVDTRALAFSEVRFELETGKYYKWVITSDGFEEIMLQAPELFRKSWINQIVISDLEVHMFGAPFGVEFDDEGDITIFFIPLRPGDYDFYVPGYEDRGLRGTFVVR